MHMWQHQIPETFSSSLTNALYRTRLLQGVVGGVTLTNDTCFDGLNTGIADQLQQTARLIKKRDGLQANRDAFYTDIGGFDTHSDNGPALTALLKQIDDAIGCFKNEMVSQGIWGNVTVRFNSMEQSFANIVQFTDVLCCIFDCTFFSLCLHQNLHEH